MRLRVQRCHAGGDSTIESSDTTHWAINPGSCPTLAAAPSSFCPDTCGKSPRPAVPWQFPRSLRDALPLDPVVAEQHPVLVECVEISLGSSVAHESAVLRCTVHGVYPVQRRAGLHQPSSRSLKSKANRRLPDLPGWPRFCPSPTRTDREHSKRRKPENGSPRHPHGGGYSGSLPDRGSRGVLLDAGEVSLRGGRPAPTELTGNFRTRIALEFTRRLNPSDRRND